MKVTKKMFAEYLGIHPTNIKPYYEDYIEELGLKRKYLLISDIARNDRVTINYVFSMMGLKLNENGNFIPKKD